MSDDPFDDIDEAPPDEDPFEDIDEAPSDEDPFEDLADDRHPGAEGDPPADADDLPGSDGTPATGDDLSGGDGPPDADPIEELSGAGSDPEEPLFEDRGVDRTDDPFADLETGEIPGDDPFGDLGEAGETIDDSVWADLSAEGTAEQVTEEGERRVSQVNKHSFCEQCPHFTGPPRIACTNEGTEIRRFVDMETVEVVDCPVVEERERLRQGQQ